METRRSILVRAGAGTAAMVLPGMASASTFPDQPLKLILPTPAGGAADNVSRTVTTRLEKILGQPIVFDYRPGASGAIAAEVTAKSPPNGYTLFWADSSVFAYVPNMRKVPYDPLTSLVPVATLGVIPFMVVVRSTLPVKDLRELVAYAKANPGKLNYGSGGIGSPHHLIGELFNMRAGTTMKHVPYKGGTPALTDLSGGQVDLTFSPVASAIPFLQNGRVRPLFVTTAKRTAALPQLPTAEEQGLSGFDESPWTCFATSVGVPAATLDILREAFRKVYADPEVVSTLAKQGMEEVGVWTPAQVSQKIKTDFVKWGEVIRKANITMDS